VLKIREDVIKYRKREEAVPMKEKEQIEQMKERIAFLEETVKKQAEIIRE